MNEQNHSGSNTIKSISHGANDEVKNMFYQLYGDKNRYTQMVLNFLSNSVHYTKKGGKITINLVLLEEQIIKPNSSNATQ
jgi:signal transduction histidine kinase